MYVAEAPAVVPMGEPLDGATAGEGPAERELVGVLQVGTDGQPARQACHRDLRGALTQPGGNVQRGRLAGGGRVGGDDHLPNRAVGVSVNPLVELGDLQVLGVHPVDRRQRTAQHVVAAGELVGAFDGDDVGGLLDHADELRVAALVGADAAARAVGEVEPDLAQTDPLLDLANGVGQGEGLPVGGAPDVEGGPRLGPAADARKLGQLGDEPLNRGCVQGDGRLETGVGGATYTPGRGGRSGLQARQPEPAQTTGATQPTEPAGD